jgi:serine protease
LNNLDFSAHRLSMIRTFRTLAALGALALLPWPLTAAAQGVASPPNQPARAIVKLAATSPILQPHIPTSAAERSRRARELGQRIGLVTEAGRGIAERTQVVTASGVTSEELARRLGGASDVEYAVPDHRRYRLAAPNDPLYPDNVPGNSPASGQWYLRAPTGDVRSSIDIEPAWTITTGSAGAVVAVIDTGVRFEHPDLLAVSVGGKLLPGYDMVSNSAIANDGSGRDASAADPGDWVSASEANDAGGFFYECTPRNPATGRFVAVDSSWHGTRVSGVIAALTNNGVGMASVGPSLRVLPVRALGKCGGYDSDIIAAIRWAAGLSVPGAPANANRAQVINLSLGGAGACSAAYRETIDAVAAVGSVIVAAAGNTAGHAVSSPANCPGVIAVAALRHVGTKVGFSDLGPEIAIAAPGGNCVNVAPGTPCLYPILTTSNSGLTTPVTSIYTDSFKITVGTSFSSPLVAGAAALVLSAQPAIAPAAVRRVLQATSRPFPTTGADDGDGTVVPVCTPPQYDAQGQPVEQLQCYCTTATCGAGILDSGAAVIAASAGLPGSGAQADGLWWNFPAGSESGWGINFAHQGNVVFATWFTYGADGKPWWLILLADKVAPGVYSGPVSTVTGPPFNAAPFPPSAVLETVVGTATLTFVGGDHATFAYTVNGVSQTKTITRQLFAEPVPTCVWGTHPDLAAAASYQGLWWNDPPGSEAGWGINFSHQGEVLVATWFSYDAQGKPWWLIGVANRTASGAYIGELSSVTGPPFNSVPFDPAMVFETVVGAFTVNFIDGNHASFAYNVNGVAQTKQITRQLFAPPAATVCRALAG